jgi:hypothetical protein
MHLHHQTAVSDGDIAYNLEFVIVKFLSLVD